MRDHVAYLVQFVANLVNDPSFETYTQDQIQHALDAYRFEAVQDTIIGIGRSSASGIAYSSYQSGVRMRYWETDAEIETPQWSVLTPDDADYRNGRFTFETPRTDSYLLISGWSHDPYAAAHDILIGRAAMVSEDLTSFSTQAGSFSYAALAPSVQTQAMQYWPMSRAAYQGGKIVRTDVNAY